jgi:hypothetical protein
MLISFSASSRDFVNASLTRDTSVSQIKLPIIPSKELLPRVRLAHKLKAALSVDLSPNERKGELYEVAVGIRLQQFGWLTGGYQIGRQPLHDGEPDQRLYVSGNEIDALLRRGVDRRLAYRSNEGLIGRGGTQIREAIEYALVDQVQAEKEGRRGHLAGLVYAEPNRTVDQAQRKIVENVAKLIRERDFYASTNCTRDDFLHALDINSRKLGIPVKDAENRLHDIAQHYKDFPVAEYRRQVFAEVDALLGVSLTTLNPERLQEQQLEELLQPEFRELKKALGADSTDSSQNHAATSSSPEGSTAIDS